MARRKQKTGKPHAVPAKELPPALAITLAEQLGDELQLLEEVLQRPSPVSIRVNPHKQFNPGGDKIPWCSTGSYLMERPAFTFDPYLHAGAYYVQEASSMFLEHALKASGLLERDILALDLCAAPGGKSTHLRSLLSAGSLLVANEIDRQRQHVLQENLWKWGRANVIITGSAPADLAALPGHFDLIVVDAPCSGEGMFRKDPFAREQWNPDLVRRCARVQHGIVQHAWDALAPGGVLIYSTCTWESVENEEQLIPLLSQGGAPLDVPIHDQWGIIRSENNGIIGYRFYPHRVLGEGFFLGMMQKPGAFMQRRSTTASPKSQIALPYLRHPESLELIEQNGVQYALDHSWSTNTQQLRSVLRTLAPGIPVAEMKGTEWRPHPVLALNELLDITEIHTLDLDVPQAIAYLKGHALPASGARGTALAMHGDLPLGWLQGAGNRWNNRWPPAWRIRSQGASAVPVAWARQ